MNLSPDQLLTNLLDDHQPKKLLLVGGEKPPAIQQYIDSQNDNSIDLTTLTDPSLLSNIESRFDFCLITPDFIEQDKQGGIELLAGIRNRLCHHIYLFIPLSETASTVEGWTEKDLFSLGLKRLAQFESKESNLEEDNNTAPILNCFAYQIESYIKKRDWNNSRFWANPEQFDKHWW